jgi:putative acetyltransferase
MELRLERPSEEHAVDSLHERAFAAHGHHGVGRLVHALRADAPEPSRLSLAAVEGEAVVGHAMFTPSLLDAPARLVQVQVLSPIAVEPDRQRQGIGGRLVEEGVRLLAERGAPLVFLEGDPAYYSRHGFVEAGPLGFRKPSLRIPDAGFQVRLLPAYEPWMTGTLVYRQTFWDHDVVGLR